MFRRIMTSGAIVALVLGLAAAPAPAVPAATVDSQYAWVLDVSTRLPASAAELQQHLDATLLAAVGGADGFNKVVQPLGAFTAGPVISRSATTLRRVVTAANAGGLLATLVVDGDGLLSGLSLTPYLPAPTSWAQVDAELKNLAPRVSFAAARVTPSGCTLTHGVNPGTARPLGSAFKMYVLGALARTIAAGKLSWNTPLALNPAWKSLPSGVLQDQPGGKVYTLAQYADYMISISDNTAADHLLHEVGRDQVGAQFALWGNHAAGNDPVLSTRELFALRSWQYPLVATAYAVLPPRLRGPALTALDRVPLTSLGAWAQPRMISSLEWFGSPLDMCRAMAGLWSFKDPQVDTAMTLNDGGLGLPSADYPTVWFKGGSEPGVLTLNYLARASDGSLVTASLMLSDPAHPLDEATVTPQAVALLRGALQLAAG
ncbi:serine hydrolase [Actinoplanes sp. NPDC051411]|uniref:serine hydrolase n=1 Tax=Actinoplanes sp. NPDC051411 TaxID=3155522 RepID=UPI0034207D43